MIQEKQRFCPKCNKVLKKVKGRRMVYECSEHGMFRVTIKRQKDYSNPKNWKASCTECGGTMDYWHFKYCCRKCGYVLEV
jgi:hypothetical protein